VHGAEVLGEVAHRPVRARRDARLLAGDVLALAGTLEAIEAASELLREPAETPPER